MTPQIITDTSLLRQKSENIDTSESNQIIADLLAATPDEALGLAAPQIGEFKRVFLANLTVGKTIFINPKIEKSSPDKTPSFESCLSIPDVRRCVERYYQVWVNADSILKIHTNSDSLPMSEKINGPLRLKSLDSYIVQHEIDHLDGILIIDRPEAKSTQQKAIEHFQKTKQRVQSRRVQKRSDKIKEDVVIKQNIQLTKKEKRKNRKKELKNLEIQERYLMSQQKLSEKKLDTDLDGKNT